MMLSRVVIVHGDAWRKAVTDELVGLGLEVEVATEFSPQREGVLCTLIGLEACETAQLRRLERSLASQAWVRPCLLAIEHRVDDRVRGLVEAGLRHIVA